mmetsp:Transcript_16305/g.45255  ORF Transcript_16305/g.45255 Transcript_16305/m.45255 type:complete len:405 (-) Transcript_16305:70-1284(-)
MQESLSAEHGSEIFCDALEHLLNGSGVAGEGHGHLQALRRDVADRDLDVVRDPFHEVRRILVLHIEHLLIDLLCAHAAAEERSSREVAAVAGVGRAHHVLGIEHLLRQFRYGQGAVLLRAAGCQGSEAGHEEVETWEGDEINRDLAQVAVQLTREAEAGGDTAHGRRDEVVEVAIGRRRQLQGPEADVVQCFVIQEEALVGVLHELVERQNRVVGLDDGIAHLGRGDDGESLHDAVGVLLAHLADEQRAHAGAGAAAEGMAQLETLQAIATLGLLADDVQDGVDELRALSIVALGPIVARTALSEHEVVRAEKLTERTSADAVHGAGLEVHEDGAGHVAAAGGLVEVHIDSLQLKVRITMIGARGVNAVLVGDDLPKLGTDLVAALTSLDVHKLTHGCNLNELS